MKKAQKHLLIPFTLCALLLLAAVTWQVIASQRLAALENRRQVLGREIQVLRSVVTGILDAETGQRGYLLTGGKPAYLEPFTKAREALKGNFAELFTLLRNDAARLSDVEELEKYTKLKLAELEETISIFRRGDRAAALKIVETDRGKSYMDVLRIRLDKMILLLTEERTQIGAEAIQRIEQVRNGLISMSTLIVAILVFTYFLVARVERERSAFAARLEHAAHHDQLTGLPNRHFLRSHFGDALQEADTRRHRLALFYIDLDNFKAVNDRHGHDAGDKVLKEAVRVLRSLLDGAGTLIRMGGDEFALVYTPAPNDTALARLASDMIRGLGSVKLADGTPSGISASIGVALFPDNSARESDLFQAADAAMYRAKNSGKARFVFAGAAS